MQIIQKMASAPFAIIALFTSLLRLSLSDPGSHEPTLNAFAQICKRFDRSAMVDIIFTKEENFIGQVQINDGIFGDATLLKYSLCPEYNISTQLNCSLLGNGKLAVVALYDDNNACLKAYTQEDLIYTEYRKMFVDILVGFNNDKLLVLKVCSNPTTIINNGSIKIFKNNLTKESLEAIVVNIDQKDSFKLDRPKSMSIFFEICTYISMISAFVCLWFCNHMTIICKRRPFDIYLIFYTCFKIGSIFQLIPWYKSADTLYYMLLIGVYILIAVIGSIYFERKGPVFTYKIVVPIYKFFNFFYFAMWSFNYFSYYTPLPLLYYAALYLLPSLVTFSRPEEWSISIAIATQLYFQISNEMGMLSYKWIIWHIEKVNLFYFTVHFWYIIALMIILVPTAYLRYRFSVWISKKIEKALESQVEDYSSEVDQDSLLRSAGQSPSTQFLKMFPPKKTNTITKP